MSIDTSFDFRIDAFGKDPDTHSATLRQYHQQLWSRPLPSGRSFHLHTNKPGRYLHHSSEVGEFSLTSDSVIPSFTRWKRLRHIIEQFPEDENEAFRRIGYTIGGIMIFPGNVIDGKQTINGARGFNSRIADRFDLTLECIRRHYVSQDSPLRETFERYRDFFTLFLNFEGYVQFFMLQDLVDTKSSTVQFFMMFEDFTTPSVPKDKAEYAEYRNRSIEFVEARNRRIDRHTKENL